MEETALRHGIMSTTPRISKCYLQLETSSGSSMALKSTLWLDQVKFRAAQHEENSSFSKCRLSPVQILCRAPSSYMWPVVGMFRSVWRRDKLVCKEIVGLLKLTRLTRIPARQHDDITPEDIPR